MVLPLIIGVGVTLLAVSARSGFRAWSVYKTLTPMMVARLNNIRLDDDKSYRQKFHNDLRFDSNRLSKTIKSNLEQQNIGGFFSRMTEAEALLILDISANEIRDLNTQLVKSKHRSAIIRNHPDKGGSPFITAKINEAREIILKSPLVKGR
ncbi:similar to Saccharomyces cerevisiae YNL328C MDJ2 Constituent of the mitochondrial import motor associated with the presequence translocase [Maudiozyma saulgeensis]|uniref:Similar to Saccharomyces cerevisiae YNL328C MDJ2 Constituent of the mitochondrial import motor associated with the presequence translocase n=1 Tax=Maudiozyma saulgeensis TaxID=1789683 RepID=A0A1X7R1E5_9SACH|nr:similar to Saccharomyces cerevisiae YNL328C MDJ2 Constituent of the mitochondrial import motor associated with the presequence translocase [Kazachstania saulgeensis]